MGQESIANANFTVFRHIPVHGSGNHHLVLELSQGLCPGWFQCRASRERLN